MGRTAGGSGAGILGRAGDAGTRSAGRRRRSDRVTRRQLTETKEKASHASTILNGSARTVLGPGRPVRAPVDLGWLAPRPCLSGPDPRGPRPGPVSGWGHCGTTPPRRRAGRAPSSAHPPPRPAGLRQRHRPHRRHHRRRHDHRRAPRAPDRRGRPARHQPSSIGLNPFSSGHLLGTDEVGRDILSRLMYGTRLALLVAVAPTLVALVIGGCLGLLSGCVGGWLGSTLMRVFEMMFTTHPSPAAPPNSSRPDPWSVCGGCPAGPRTGVCGVPRTPPNSTPSSRRCRCGPGCTSWCTPWPITRSTRGRRPDRSGVSGAGGPGQRAVRPGPRPRDAPVLGCIDAGGVRRWRPGP